MHTLIKSSKEIRKSRPAALGWAMIKCTDVIKMKIRHYLFSALSPLLHILIEMGFPVVLIPWVVLQEMDSLKKGKGLSGSVAHLAIPAISYIYNSLKSREPHLWGQSMQQAAESSSECLFKKNMGLQSI